MDANTHLHTNNKASLNKYHPLQHTHIQACTYPLRRLYVGVAVLASCSKALRLEIFNYQSKRMSKKKRPRERREEKDICELEKGYLRTRKRRSELIIFIR